MIVPVSGPLIYPEDKKLVIQAVEEGWYTEGKYCARFAHSLKSFLGMKYCVLCNSGSSANLLAVTALKRLYDIPDGKKVITCATGFPTTVFPIIQNRLVPLFVDANKWTLNADVIQVYSAMDDPDVCGIILAHTLGFPYNSEDMVSEAKKRGLFFIEDCADALGAENDGGKKIGSFGDCSTYSFFPAHHITTGEGGAVVTNDERLSTLLDRFCSWGRDCHCLPGQDNSCGNRFGGSYGILPKGYDHKYVFSEIGYNLKMTEIQGALGLAQMRHLPKFIEDRRNHYHYLSVFIQGDPIYHNHFMRTYVWGKSSPFGFPIIWLHPEKTVSQMARFLDARGVKSRPIFAGNILRQPVNLGPKEVYSDLSGSDFLMDHAIWIGLHPALTYEQLDYAAESVIEYAKT